MAIDRSVKVITPKIFRRDRDLRWVLAEKTRSECAMKSAAWEGYFAQRMKKRSSQPVSRVLSWTVIHLGRASPRASSDLPGSRAGRTLRAQSARKLPYLVLLRVGFTVPRAVTSRAVRSYRTFSPLPAPKRLGGVFSVALSVGSRRPGVTWHPALRSPDFPLRNAQRLPG